LNGANFDLEAQLYGGLISPENGKIKMRQGPGLGFDPDPNIIRDYLRVDSSPSAI
jgi:hypothetical protein